MARFNRRRVHLPTSAPGRCTRVRADADCSTGRTIRRGAVIYSDVFQSTYIQTIRGTARARAARFPPVLSEKNANVDPARLTEG